MQKLSMKQIEALIPSIPLWTVFTDDNCECLRRFVQDQPYSWISKKVGDISGIADKMGHHPEISFGYDRLEISLFTHSLNGLSEEDFELAQQIDRILEHR